MGCTAEYKRPGHRYDRSVEKLKRKESTAIQVIKVDYHPNDDIESSYEAVVEQAYELKRIDTKTRLKLLSEEEVLKETDHIGSLFIDVRLMFDDKPFFEDAALNHDVIEKGLLCYKELQAEFGKETADLIAGVTDYRYVDRRGCFLREWIPNRGLRELTWRKRKEASLERLKKSDHNVVILKFLDADDELCKIVNNGFDKSIADWEFLRWYYGELLKLFRKTPELRSHARTKYFARTYSEFFRQNKT